MGSPKALLSAPDGRAFLSRIVGTLVESGFPRVRVVTGRDHEAIEGLCAATTSLRDVVALERNPDPDRGQLSSLLVGLDAVAVAGVEGVLVTLVDVPMVTAFTVRRVVDRWRQTRAPIVRPACAGRHGHPVIFDAAVFSALRAAPLDVGAKAVVRAYDQQIEDVEVDDPWCVSDVDTAADYEALSGGRVVPSGLT
jgi:CTP:molybdopterin cytidylyltransferase MocA